MADEIRFDSNALSIAGRLRRMADLMPYEVKKAMKNQAARFVGKVQVERMSGRPGLNSQGGARNALTFAISGNTFDDLAVSIGWPRKYWWLSIHETGGDIKAKNRKFLAIPFPGTIGATKSRARESGLRPQDFDRKKTFIARGKNTKAGNLIIFEKLAGGKVRPIFILTPRVTMPARLGYYAMFNREKEHFIRAVVDSVDDARRRAGL